MASFVFPMPPFNPDDEVGGNQALRWRTWLADFKMFLAASNITNKTRQRALLLYQAGPRVREIFRQFPEPGADDDVAKAEELLTAYFEPQKNRLYQVYKFQQAKQEASETIDQFHTRLHSLAKNCEFSDVSFEIMVQIVIGGKSSRVRKQALRDPKYSLQDLLLDVRREETSKVQAADIEGSLDGQALNAFNTKISRGENNKTCFNCGGDFPHKERPCPAKNKTCTKCGKQNHFAKQCRSRNSNTRRSQKPHENRRELRPMRQSDDESSSNSDSEDKEYCYAVNNKQKYPHASVSINGQRIKMTVDTGSSINVIGKNTFAKLRNIELKPTTVKAYPFNSDKPVKMEGKFRALAESKHKFTVATIYVTSEDGGCLPSSETAQELGLVSLHLNQINKETASNNSEQQTYSKPHVNDKNLQRILDSHTPVFSGLGKLRNKQVKLAIDETVTPVAQPQRKIPFHLRQKVEHEIEKLKHDDIIEKIRENTPTEWVSPVVIVPKQNNNIRLCVDMRVANTAIKRTRHPIPTLESVSMELNGASFFSKLDLCQAYHQLELSPESRNITTFCTHLGLFRYKRLNYGTNAAAELFQHTLQQTLQGIKGVKNIADDIIVFGNTREEHDRALEECLTKLQEHNLTLNLEKCKFLKKNLEFFGLVFTEQGVSPDPKKVQAFANTQRPTTVSEVRSLLGMANYSSKFIKDYATITEPLRKLTRKNTRFTWTHKQQAAYDNLKHALLNSPVMSHFDTSKETSILVDASPVGLSAILTQKDPQQNAHNIIAYASRALSPVEKRYSQTEKEALAIVWGIEHFHLYVFGAPFILVTDHKPLQLIYNNPHSRPPARIERWFLRLQQYDFQVIYKKGSDNPADFLSRHPQPKVPKHSIAEEYINFVTVNATEAAIPLTVIREHTSKDSNLIAVQKAAESGDWTDKLVKPFFNIKDEIAVDNKNGVVLRGTRIIIPTTLQTRIVKLAHAGHQGLAKTKALLRQYAWFPNMDKAAKQEIEACLRCQVNGAPNPPEPLLTPGMPDGPWQIIHADFYGPLSTGQYIIVLIDKYSRYPETEIINNTSAKTLIPKLHVIFARHGIPHTLKSDNGPPLNGNDFKTYLTKLGIKHETSTPDWPQGNSEAEAFMKPLGKAIRAARAENRNWVQELSRFLLSYRTTPHSSTSVPPAQLLFNRPVRGTLPMLNPKDKVLNRHKEAKTNDAKAKTRARDYANKRRHAKSSDLKVGDKVILKQRETNLPPNLN